MKKIILIILSFSLPLIFITAGCETGKKTLKAINGGYSLEDMLDDEEPTENESYPPIPPPNYDYE